MAEKLRIERFGLFPRVHRTAFGVSAGATRMEHDGDPGPIEAARESCGNAIFQLLERVPFTFAMLIMAYAFLRALGRDEPMPYRHEQARRTGEEAEANAPREAAAETTGT